MNKNVLPMITFVAMTKDHDYNHVTQRQIIEKQNGHYRILNPFNPGKDSKPHSRCTNPANMHSPPQQQTIPAIPLSSYSFTQAFIGRSDFDGDNATAGSVDEFRIYDNAQSASAIAADFAAGPNVVPEPSSLAFVAIGALGLLARRRFQRTA